VRPESEHVDGEAESIAYDRELVRRRGLYGFVQASWHLVEPTHPFVPNWHLEQMAAHCEAMARGDWTRGVINVPPSSGKSTVVSICWHPWAWITQPELKFMFASYKPALAFDHAMKAKRIISSPWYRARWPGVEIVGGERAAVGDYSNTAGGFRLSDSVHGGFTGRHADIQVADDPHKPIDTMNSGVSLDFVSERFWKGTMSSRARDPSTGRRLVIMQRLHEADLAGACLADGYEHLSLPMRFDPARASRTTIGGDPRTVDGELLFPKRFPLEEVVRLERELGAHADAQLQQEATTKGGGPIKQEHFRYWRFLPERFDALLWSWDCAFKDAESSDDVCGQLWGKSGGDYYLLWRVLEKLDFSTTLQVVEQMRAWSRPRFGLGGPVLVEDKANGTAVINVLAKKISGFIAATPLGSKVARASAVSYLFRAGNVFFPDPTMPNYAWSKDHAETVRKFPRVKHDDTVDAMTQALSFFESEAGSTMSDAIESFIRFKGATA